jgi:hypothetical protein
MRRLDLSAESRRLDGRAQKWPRQIQLALYNRRRPHQAEKLYPAR